jgi:hypothetical protein
MNQRDEKIEQLAAHIYARINDGAAAGAIAEAFAKIGMEHGDAVERAVFDLLGRKLGRR